MKIALSEVEVADLINSKRIYCLKSGNLRVFQPLEDNIKPIECVA